MNLSGSPNFVSEFFSSLSSISQLHNILLSVGLILDVRLMNKLQTVMVPSSGSLTLEVNFETPPSLPHIDYIG